MHSLPLDTPGLLSQIVRLARDRIDQFELNLISSLKQKLNLIGCTLYSDCPLAGMLCLRGQVGFRYEDYESFLLNKNSPAGRVFESRKVMTFRNLDADTSYRDKNLVRDYKLHSMIVIPIFRESQEVGEVVTSLCLYPKSEHDIESISKFMKDSRELINEAFLISLGHTFQELRSDIVFKALSVTDPASFFFKALRHLSSWGFEGASVFSFDAKAKCLRLTATTGLADKDTPKRNVYYRINEVESITVQAFVNRREMLISRSTISQRHPKSRERTLEPFNSALVIPYFSPKFRRFGDQKSEDCLGVIRLTNRFLTHGSNREVVEFSWEDHELIRFFLDLAGVVVHMFNRVSAKINEFERVVHGLETNVLTIIGALRNVENFVDYRSTFPLELRNSLPTSVAFAETIHEQIRVFKLRNEDALANVRCGPMNLYGPVISKLRPFAQTTAQFYSVHPVEIDLSSFQSIGPDNVSADRFLEIPQVFADADLLLSVFKNLVENSIKYSVSNARCKIALTWGVDDQFVKVEVSDNGIGIPPEDEEFVFNESYQAENAMRRRTAGAGIGLFQCRAIMESLKGEIILDRQLAAVYDFSTTFVVKIPRK